MKRKFWENIYFWYGIITIVAFLFYITHSHARWLNQDDLASVHVIAGKHSLSELIERNKLMGLQPPLPAIIFYLWAQLTPATVDWIKMPSVIAVTLSIFFTCCIGKKLKSERAGIYAGVLMAASAYSFEECVFSARTYGIFVLASVMVYWFHLKLAEEYENGTIRLRTVLFSGLALIILFYSHYFGILLAFGLGLADLIKIIATWKKCNKKASVLWLLAPYVIGLAAFMPWLFGVILREYNELEEVVFAWLTTPTVKDLFVLIYYFFDNVIITGIFALIFIYFIYKLFKDKASKKYEKASLLYLFVIVVYVGISFVYSAYIKADGSMWVRRYFCGLMPVIYLLCAFALDEIENNQKRWIKWITYGFLVVIIAINWVPIPWNTKQNIKAEYKNTIEYFAENQVDEQTDAVIYSSWWGDAFNYFYTDNFRNDKKPAVTKLDGENVPEEINIVYVLTAHLTDWDNRITDPAFELESIDNENQVAVYRRR